MENKLTCGLEKYVKLKETQRYWCPECKRFFDKEGACPTDQKELVDAVEFSTDFAKQCLERKDPLFFMVAMQLLSAYVDFDCSERIDIYEKDCFDRKRESATRDIH